MARTRGSATKYEDQQMTDTILTTLQTAQTLYEAHVLPLLPESLQNVSITVLNALSMSYPYLSQTVALLSSFLKTNSANAGTQDSSALMSLGILLLTAYAGLRTVNYIRRTIFGWIMLGVKLMLLLFAVQVGLYINTYGVDKALRDAGWIGGIVWGLVEQFMESGQESGQVPRGMRSRDNARNPYAGAQRTRGR